MKIFSRLLTASLFAVSIQLSAQITLVHTFPPNYSNITSLQNVYLKHSGFKFVYLHSDTLSFYNLNLSLYENAIFPASWLSTTFDVQDISEGLFDTDTLHIDFLLQNGDSTAIYKDNGNIVYRNDSAIPAGSFPGMGGPVYWNIIPTDSGTFMVLHVSYYKNQLYKLPGSLPCLPACYSNEYTSVAPIINNSGEMMNVYPNPSITYSNIYYTLPRGVNQGEIVVCDLTGRELKKYTVTSQFDHLRLTTSDIAAGTYLYQLMVNGNSIATKKIIVVK